MIKSRILYIVKSLIVMFLFLGHQLKSYIDSSIKRLTAVRVFFYFLVIMFQLGYFDQLVDNIDGNFT